MTEEKQNPEEESANVETDESSADEQSDVDETVTDSELAADLADANARAMRSQAELENFRKRMRREMEDTQRYAAMPILRELLPVVDDMQRAIAAAEQSEDKAGLLAGVKMVEARLRAALSQHGCQQIEAEGAEFDPAKHEAILMQPSTEHEPGKVMQVTQQGYQLHDRVIRPAQVIVAQASQEQTAE